ncbi:hypothetical protein D3C85_1279750 [compost metagenome]
MIIIQHQQQRRSRRQVHGQLVEQAVQPLFEGKRLMALTHFQQSERLPTELRKIVLQTFQQTLKKSTGITVPRAQPQPEAAPVIRQRLTELHRQRTFAKPRRRTDKQ